jgi:hypothetical protein
VTSTKPTTPAVETEDGATRVGPMHQAFAAWLASTHGVSITPEQIFAVTSKRKQFRNSDAYRVGVKTAQTEAKAAEQAAKEKARQEREAERQRKAQEKAAEKAPAAPVQKTTPAAKAQAVKPATKKATPAKSA